MNESQVNKLIKELDLDILTNAVLVNAGARNAFLFQYIDEGETDETGPKSAKKLRLIAKLFPELRFTKNHQGMIISRNSYNNQSLLNTSQATLGKILDYPCATEFESLNRTKVTYGVNVDVWFRTISPKTTIFSNICPSKSSLPKFEKLAAKFRTALKADPIIGPYVVDVVVEVEEIVPNTHMIKLLAGTAPLRKVELAKLDNILFNAGYSDNLSVKQFQLDNPVHRGIMLSVVIHETYNTLEPFFPLQYTGKAEQVEEATQQQEKAILKVLKDTRN